MSNSIPLNVVYQQCHDDENLSPTQNFPGWEECLNRVYSTRNPAPTLAENANAIWEIWGGELSRTLFLNALKGIVDTNGNPVYAEANIYIEANKHWPITLSITVNTDETIRNNYASVSVTDDNGDPAQGSDEITVNCKVGNTLIWKAHPKTGSETINLLQFVRTGGVNLFAAGYPEKQDNGSWQGSIVQTGNETYHFNFSIGSSSKIYTWDPFINATN